MKKTTLGKYSALFAGITLLAACGAGSNADGEFNADQTINVVTREDGSGTRGAFVELTGVLVEDGDNETDETYQGATIQNGTNGVMTAVSGDVASIGYTSVGSLNDSVKEVKIGGAEPTAEAIEAGDYEISRPFNVAYSGTLSDAAADFWSFVFSAEGQEIVAAEGYIEGLADAPVYEATEGVSGSVGVVGSTSVTPVMEAIAEAYQEVQPDVSIDITSNGSSAGMTAALDGSADIGMASRELKDEEAAELTHQPLAIDGIAVIVNPNNPVEDLTLEEVRQIFTGEEENWSTFIQE